VRAVQEILVGNFTSSTFQLPSWPINLTDFLLD